MEYVGLIILIIFVFGYDWYDRWLDHREAMKDEKKKAEGPEAE